MLNLYGASSHWSGIKMNIQTRSQRKYAPKNGEKEVYVEYSNGNYTLFSHILYSKDPESIFPLSLQTWPYIISIAS